MSSLELEARRTRFAVPDIRVNIANTREALRAVSDRARSRRGYTLFTANLDHLDKLRRDRRFGEAYARADFVTADGWPIVWHMKRRGQSLERTTGADLLEPICRHAAEHALPMYFVGPGAESQAAGLRALGARLPGLVVAGREAPRFAGRLDGDAADAMARRIAESGARLCVVSLGAPKQELLADMLLARCPEVGFLCFGAALDFASGHDARAPKWMRAAGLEWLWRLARAPGRLAGRYLRCAGTLAGLALSNFAPSRLVRIELRAGGDVAK
jgi:exopolysaccharide biosynthesis WecB/TagA/CpsF family protein